MKKISILFALVLPLLLISCNGSKKTKKTTTTTRPSKSKSAVNFTNSKTLSSVLDKAKAEDKLVFVDFYTTWCLPCKMMDQDVFTDKRLAKFMNDNFVSYKVNAEKGNGVNLAVVYEIYAYPTLLFMDEKGKVLEQKVGAAYQTEMMEMAERALAARGN